jgi:hypothetical protein
MKSRIRLALLPLLFFPVLLFSQTQTLRGIVLDKQAETPLIGATVQVLNLEPAIGATTDLDGAFALKNVPVGRQTLRITYLGYEVQTVPNVLLTAGKEVLLTIKMEESFTAMSEVVITAKVDKDKAINDLATISARQFNTEEVSRYSGGRGDVVDWWPISRVWQPAMMRATTSLFGAMPQPACCGVWRASQSPIRTTTPPWEPRVVRCRRSTQT